MKVFCHHAVWLILNYFAFSRPEWCQFRTPCIFHEFNKLYQNIEQIGDLNFLEKLLNLIQSVKLWAELIIGHFYHLILIFKQPVQSWDFSCSLFTYMLPHRYHEDLSVTAYWKRNDCSQFLVELTWNFSNIQTFFFWKKTLWRINKTYLPIYPL